MPGDVIFVVLCNQIEWCEFIGCASTLAKAKNMANIHVIDNCRVPPTLMWKSRDRREHEDIVCTADETGEQYEIRKIEVK